MLEEAAASWADEAAELVAPAAMAVPVEARVAQVAVVVASWEAVRSDGSRDTVLHESRAHARRSPREEQRS